MASRPAAWKQPVELDDLLRGRWPVGPYDGLDVLGEPLDPELLGEEGGFIVTAVPSGAGDLATQVATLGVDLR
jgi:hypothetical protein